MASSPPRIFHPGDPLPTARAAIYDCWSRGNLMTLRHFNGEFFHWNGRCYRPTEIETIQAHLYRYLEKALVPDGDELKPFRPTKAKVQEVVNALKAETHLPAASLTPPLWLGKDHENRPNPRDILACQNGLLTLPNLEIQPLTPEFFSVNALDFDFDPSAPETSAWMKFLNDLWPDDPHSIETLQEIFGYCLLPDTSQQKMFLLVGPKRSGKGTIARVLTRLIGPYNVCAPTLSSMTEQFGLQPLISMNLAIIGDARLNARFDHQVVAERLLTISGEDRVTVQRKFLPAWHGKLPTRILIISNEAPRIPDASGALASRFITLTLKRSFFGQEDLGLSGRLLKELPGILNWSIAGWSHLQERGHFVQPFSSDQVAQQLEDLASPIKAFVREKCLVKAGQVSSVDLLYEAWSDWCASQGRPYVESKQVFGRDLHSAFSEIEIKQRRKNGNRIRVYEGIGLL